MGKSDKIKNKKARRHNPLDQDIIGDKHAKLPSRMKIKNREADDDECVNEKLTTKILDQARKQQEDLEEEVGLGSVCKQLESSRLFDGLFEGNDDDKSDGCQSSKEEFDFNKEIEISEEDQKAFERFMPENAEKRATLADIIKEKLTEKQTELRTVFSDDGSLRGENYEKAQALYEGVGKVLSMYRSGPLPKAFKALPKLTYWEELLYLTNPDSWTAAAMYQATRLFSSNLKANMAQRFYNLILLPRLRDDIAECKKLNYHLYMALKKALFKPAAFFKGIIIPLCEDGSCTLREAFIFGSVLAKCSIPILHSSATLLMIAAIQDYNGANSVFMRILLEKKYSLPYRVIDGVVDHFLRFMDDDREFPVLWHQCLLTFAQIYKNDLSAEQKKELLRLLTRHLHPLVTPEIRRELQSGLMRKVASTEAPMTVENVNGL